MSRVPTLGDLRRLAERVWPGRARVVSTPPGYEIWASDPNRYCGGINLAATQSKNRIALAAALSAIIEGRKA